MDMTAISGLITAVATGVMVWAVWKAPQKALEVQWQLQLRDEERKRRMRIFRTLMATRGNTIQYQHVEALNLIDVEFYKPEEADIQSAWKAYLDHLVSHRVPDEIAEPDEAKRKAVGNRIVEQRRDLLAELLQKMGTHLGYRFDFTYLKDRAYYPEGHGRVVEEEGAVRRGLMEMLWRGRPLIVRAMSPIIKIAEDNPKLKA